MAKPVQPIPDGYHSVTPHLVVKDAAAAIEFYKKALGATELLRMPGPEGKIAHAEVKIGDSIIFLMDEQPKDSMKSPQTLGASHAGLYLYVKDVDALFRRALEAGAKEFQPVQDMFWGDRVGKFTDPSGYLWGVATHKEDVTPEQIEERLSALPQR